MQRLAIVVLVLCALAVVAVPVAGADIASPQGYIVVLNPGTNPAAVAAEHTVRLGLQVGFVYTQALLGYSALVPAAALDGTGFVFSDLSKVWPAIDESSGSTSGRSWRRAICTQRARSGTSASERSRRQRSPSR